MTKKVLILQQVFFFLMRIVWPPAAFINDEAQKERQKLRHAHLQESQPRSADCVYVCDVLG